MEKCAEGQRGGAKSTTGARKEVRNVQVTCSGDLYRIDAEMASERMDLGVALEGFKQSQTRTYTIETRSRYEN